jgi:hypothetical protein
MQYGKPIYSPFINKRFASVIGEIQFSFIYIYIYNFHWKQVKKIQGNVSIIMQHHSTIYSAVINKRFVSVIKEIHLSLISTIFNGNVKKFKEIFL